MTQMAALSEAGPPLELEWVPARLRKTSFFSDSFRGDLSTFRFITRNANSKIRQNVDAEDALSAISPRQSMSKRTKTNTYSRSKVCNHSALESVDD